MKKLLSVCVLATLLLAGCGDGYAPAYAPAYIPDDYVRDWGYRLDRMDTQRQLDSMERTLRKMELRELEAELVNPPR